MNIPVWQPCTRWLATLVSILGVLGCDQRPTPQPMVVKIAAFNDFHGNLNPPTTGTRVPSPTASLAPRPGDATLELPTGGIEYLSSLITRLKAENPQTTVVAAGDLIGGSPLVATLFHHEPTIELLGEMGLEFSAVGNHEFDAGSTELLRMQRGGCAAGRSTSCRNGRFAGARFQYLAANVTDTATGALLLPAYAIKNFTTPQGTSLPIAFIGLVTSDTANLVTAAGIADLRFTEEAAAANALIPELRARGIETIVVLIHEGGRTTATAFDDDSCPNFSGHIQDIVSRLDPAIDLIISGHTHRTYVCSVGGRLVTSAGAEGRFLTDIDLRIDTNTRDVLSVSARQLAVVNDAAANPLPQRYPTLTRDARLSERVSFYNAQAAPLAQRRIGAIAKTITRTMTPAGETPLGSLIADAQLAATRSAGAQIAFMNRGGVRADLRGTAGYLTYNDVFAVHPFGNVLVTMSLTGAQIDALLEQQWQQVDALLHVSAGFSYVWDAAAPAGQRVDFASIRLHGEPLDSQRRYRITVNSFLAQGGDGFSLLKQATDPVFGEADVTALERYISAHAPLSAPPAGRIVRKN